MKFHSMTSSCLLDRGTIFSQTVTEKVLFAVFLKMRTLQFYQDADRTIRTEYKLVVLYKHLVPYSTSAVMALVWQLYRLLVNLPNFSSCFIKSII